MSFFAAFIYRQFLYTPPAPTASFKGKTVIVTGSSSGLGLEACRAMIKLGASRVILACRNIEKAEAAVNDIQATTSCAPDMLEVMHLDMSSYASVQQFSNKVMKDLPRLDVLIANAGVRMDNFQMTEDNEETITTNVVSLFLLSFLLHPKLRETATQYKSESHLTVTASELYEVAKFKERLVPNDQIFATLNNSSTANMGDRYNVSKLLEILIVKQMAALSPFKSGNVIVNCVAPGDLARAHDSTVARIAKQILCRPTEVGARTLVYGASAGPDTHGQYVPDCNIAQLGGLCKGAEGAELQERVWLELKQKLEAIQPDVTLLS